jgi:hypothetical protein
VELADRPGNLAALTGDLPACGANIVQRDGHAGAGGTVIDLGAEGAARVEGGEGERGEEVGRGVVVGPGSCGMEDLGAVIRQA